MGQAIGQVLSFAVGVALKKTRQPRDKRNATPARSGSIPAGNRAGRDRLLVAATGPR